MILVTNKVESKDSLNDSRISQAGLNYQNKLKDFLKPNLEISLMPSFIDFKYDNSIFESHVYVNTTIGKGRLLQIVRYFTDCLKVFFLTLKSNEKTVLTYNLDFHNVLFVFLSVFFSKKKNYVVVADYIIQKNRFNKLIFDFIYKKLSGVIVLNDKINVNKNTQFLAGLVSSSDVKLSESNSIPKKAIFSGSLGRTTGFGMCLDAVSKMPLVNLLITGRRYQYTENEFDTIIKKYSKFNNISFNGLLPLNEYQNILNDVDIAFSLRDPNDIEHDFNFPSKIIEYLSAGKFVISSKKYSFMPEDILFYCEFSTHSIEECINRILNMSQVERELYKKRVYNFVITNFTEEYLFNCIKNLDNYEN